MSFAATKLARARYLIKRLTESPPSFLARKAGIELSKRLDRRAVVAAAVSGRRFSEGYEAEMERVCSLARSIRSDLLLSAKAANLHERENLRVLAEDFDNQRWKCLGYGVTRLRVGEWRHDSFHDFSWPREYFASIDYVAAGCHCDVKVVWEKSRLQWLSRAALAYSLDTEAATRSVRLERIELLLDDWLSENPYGIGVNWVSAMEVAIRAVNMLATLVLLIDDLGDQARLRVLRSLGEHLHYLRRYPETSDVQGNHYLATELGVFFLEAFRRGAGMSEHAAAAFVRACREQFSADGLHVEFAPIYHRLSLDMVSLGQALMRRVCPSQARQLDSLLAKARSCCLTLANARGELPLLGDHDSGQVLDFGQSTRVLTQTESTHTPNGLDAHEALGARALAVWHQGLAGVQAFEENAVLLPALPEQGRLQRLAPYWVLERADSKVVVRAGAHGLEGRASHDHEDQLSFWFSHQGRDLLVEAGCPPYTLDLEQRSEGISSVSHNVLSIGGEQRYRPTQGSVCATVRGAPIAERLPLAEAPLCAIGLRLEVSDPSAARGLSLRHDRRLEIGVGGQVDLLDEIHCERPDSFTARLHFAPDCSLELGKSGRHWLRAASGALLLTIEIEAACELEFATETYSFHAEYGASEEATRLVIRGRVESRLELRTRLSPPQVSEER